jgi:ERCC4-type nuclease
MADLIVAGSEPEYIYSKLREEIVSVRRSNEAENYGVDYLVGNAGIQRKAIDDFIASIMDNRLYKEILQSESLGQTFLLLEGQIKTLPNGALWTKSNRWRVRTFTTQTLLKNIIRLQVEKGWKFLYSPSLQETPTVISAWYVTITSEAGGLGKSKRGAPSWNDKNNSANWMAYMMQSIPGLGPKTADRLVKMYPDPVTLNLTREQLLAVEGVGPGTVNMIFRAFGVDESTTGVA